MLITNFFFLLYRKNQDVNVISFFSLLSKNLIFIPKKKLKQNILKKKKVDNKFIINSSPCLYSPNESVFFFI